MRTILFLLVVIIFGSTSCSTKNSETPNPQTSVQVQSLKSKYAILDELDKRIKLETIPAVNVISLNFTGGYQKHPEAYGQLSQYANKNYATTGGIIGIYPQDPDLVEEAQLTWEINLRILPGKPGPADYSTQNSNDPFEIKIPEEISNAPISQFKKPENPFIIKQLKPTQAITLVSDVAHIGSDGLAINAWIDLNNYVQTGTTRTEFGSPKEKSMLIPVKIIVPIKKRNKETIQ